MTSKLSFSICVPVYKGSKNLKSALDSIFRQKVNFNYEVIVADDNPPSEYEEIKKTEAIITAYKDDRITYFKNSQNLGSALNIRKLAENANNDILSILCQDDIFAKDALQRTHDAFLISPEVGVVTRPYFWFDDDFHNPVRVVTPYNQKQDTLLSIFTGKREFLKIFETVGQLSGLAYRRKYLNLPFGDECFTGHIYPFAGILKNYKCVFLKDFTVAVGIRQSQSRHISTIYDLSPSLSWLKMYEKVFNGRKYELMKRWGKEHVANNFVGLLQIKNYARKGALEKEIELLLKLKWLNIFNPKFWFYVF